MSSKNENYRCVYSLGIRCYTEMILKDIGLRRFSSILGSLFVKNFSNLKCILDNPDILIDKEKHIYTRDVVSMTDLNEKHGFRTLHRDFDNTEDYHSATQAHHDLSTIADTNHFVRGIQRLEKMKRNHVPVLFLNTSDVHLFCASEPMSCQSVVDTLIRCGWEKFHVVFIYFSGSGRNEIMETRSTPFFTIYEHGHYTSEVDCVSTGVVQSVMSRFQLNNLITISELDELA